MVIRGSSAVGAAQRLTFVPQPQIVRLAPRLEYKTQALVTGYDTQVNVTTTRIWP
jgi:hypothetical protein